MTPTKKIIRETDIAAAVVKHLESQGLKVRQEVYVTLPDHGQIPADIIACKTDETGEWFTVVECKRRLDAELEAQAMRWAGWANEVYAAYLITKRYSAPYANRCSRLHQHGIGRLEATPSGQLLRTDAAAPNIGTHDLISAAFHSSTGAHDPQAGSAGVRRQTEARSKWEPATRALATSSMPLKWAEIQHECKTLRAVTSHQAVKAIKNGDWPNVETLDHYGPLLFRITEKTDGARK